VTTDIGRLTAILADRYIIERELGAGGMATVYLAHDVKHDRNVAVKVLRPELAAVIGAERFLAEIKTTANLQHPHILPLFDSGEADGMLFYVMPFIEGISLRDRLVREKQLPVPEAVRIATQVAAALDYAHRHGVIHRDIKPENIMLHDGSALVADFGIALAASKAGSRMTETGMSLGTPQYMSPEQAMGERELDARSDVYALGCVAYEMLVGEPPFTGPTAQAIIARVMTEEPRRLTLQRKTISPEVEGAVLHAIEKLPADRFATAAQFSDALSGQGLTVTTRATAAAPGRDGWRARFQVASGVAIVAIAFGIWSGLRGRTVDGPVERRYISLGDSVRLQTPQRVALPLALSPDGSRLAFIGDTLFRIWVKRRDALDAAPLAGTEGASSPTFSPDGQWIAYVVDGHLKKVRADGGVSITLADSAGTGFGEAWLDDGTLIYTDGSLLGLRRVKESGGPTWVAVPDTTFKGLAPMLATPLPHARGILFVVCASNCVTMSLHVLDFRTGRSKRLVDNASAGWYLPSGQLMYFEPNGVAMAVPFDLSTLSIRGAPIPLLQGVRMTGYIPELAWSTSGRLVYAIGSGSASTVTLREANRDGSSTAFDPSWSGAFNSFALSPNGRQVAVGVSTPGAGLDIWVKQLDRGPFTRLTFSGRDLRPTWSPDGRQVAFVRDSASGGDVWARAADGGGTERRLTHFGRAIQEVSWSKDGRWLLVRTETGAAGSGDIVAVSALGDTALVPIAATPATELQPALSPNGRWIAYVSNEAGVNEVFVRPFPNADAGHWQVSNGGGGSPVWSPDGKELFFLNGSDRLISAEIGPGPAFSVTRLVPLFDATAFAYVGYHWAFDVTRDGKFVYMGQADTERPNTAQLVQVDNWFADIRARLQP
jgi:eukaryotic-like serine/threonine-protein kinase